MTYWISQPENQIFLFGMFLMLAGAMILIVLAFPRTPEPVKTWEWHTEPLPRAPVTHSEFKYTVMDEWYPYVPELAEFVDAVDEVADATIELARVADPFDVTHELEIVDPSVPLFYQIKRPKPYHEDSFTIGWSRERIAEIIAAGRPQ